MYYNFEDMNNAIKKFNVVANGSEDFSGSLEEVYVRLCLEEAKELTEAIEANDSVAIAKELVDCHFVSYFLNYLNPKNVLGLSLYQWVVSTVANTSTNEYIEAFKAVCDSNMSKFVNITEMDDDEVISLGEAEKLRIEKEGRYSGVTYSVTECEGEKFMVLRDENLKVLKPSSYQEPRIKSKEE